MQSVRPAAVAGAFYPADPRELKATVERLLAEARAARQPAGKPKALIAPHAGYVYSGAIAASAFCTLDWRAGEVRRVVLLGPAHFTPLRGLALPVWRALATPLGEVAVDEDARARLPALPQVSFSDAAHAREHSLEVELPFLLAALGRFQVVPLAVGRASPEEVAGVLEQLWGGPETLIVVSSDLSHYLPYAVAKRRDEATAEAIANLQIVEADDACGAAPVNGLLLAARRKGLQCARLDLRNSGDMAGDRSSVVGYGAFAFTEAAA